MTETKASEPFQYRQTGKDIFMVDLGDTHLGTVMKISAGEWWTYPANSAGQTSFTLGTRQAAAEALLEHHTATTAGELR